MISNKESTENIHLKVSLSLIQQIPYLLIVYLQASHTINTLYYANKKVQTQLTGSSKLLAYLKKRTTTLVIDLFSIGVFLLLYITFKAIMSSATLNIP